MTPTPNNSPLGPCSSFFIVRDLATSLAHYHGQLGFDIRFQSPEIDPFFAMVGRGTAQFMLKAIAGVAPTPNPARHAWAKWDAFIFVDDPDTLAHELINRGTTLRVPLGDTDDGLRGFEVADPDGYVCFFGRPL